MKAAAGDDSEIEALSLESVVNILIIGNQAVFMKLKKYKAIKLFRMKIDKYKDYEDKGEREGKTFNISSLDANVEKIKFN